MKTREVRLTEEAERDIESIYDYIASNDSLASAEYVLNALMNCWSKLATLPGRGNVPKELLDSDDRSYRELHWKPYRIIYRIDPDVVTVYAVVDGRRDVRTFLRNRLS